MVGSTDPVAWAIWGEIVVYGFALHSARLVVYVVGQRFSGQRQDLAIIGGIVEICGLGEGEVEILGWRPCLLSNRFWGSIYAAKAFPGLSVDDQD